MLALTIRTDNPKAEIGLFKNGEKIAYETWQAHRQLAETIHIKIRELLGVKGYTFHDIGGIVCYKGPGSFTGLRIGLTVGNALALGLGVPVVSTPGKNWAGQGVEQLMKGEDEIVTMPDYGSEAHITQQKK